MYVCAYIYIYATPRAFSHSVSGILYPAIICVIRALFFTLFSRNFEVLGVVVLTLLKSGILRMGNMACCVRITLYIITSYRFVSSLIEIIKTLYSLIFIYLS